MSLAVLLFLLALLCFAIEAIWHRSLLALGLFLVTVVWFLQAGGVHVS